MTTPKEPPKEYRIINKAPDGEFTCVMGIRTEEQLPPLEELEQFRLPPRPVFPTPKPSSWDMIKDGTLYALYLGWIAAQVIVGVIAVIVAAMLVGYFIWSLTSGN